MAILAGKRLVITGVLTDASLAFGVAKLAQENGATVMLTGAGRGLSITERTARKLPTTPNVAELDVTNAAHVDQVREAARQHLGEVDGVLHSIGFAPAACLGDDLMAVTWEDVSVAMQISAFSLKTLADAFVPLMTNGGSIVGLDFDNTVAWPAYNWMGVAKSALESTSRYLARELGAKKIRCNLVAAGPIRTMAAKSIPSFAQFEDIWGTRAPLGWDINDSSAVYKWLYATWALGAALGGLALGTIFVGRDPRVMIRWGFAANAVAMAAFAASRSATPAFIAGFALGVSYFFTTTAMGTVLQGRLAAHERGRTMALWFMAFGGTVPIGNIIFGPLVDRYGTRWLLFIGAAWALVLAWWCNTRALDERYPASSGASSGTSGAAAQPKA